MTISKINIAGFRAIVETLPTDALLSTVKALSARLPGATGPMLENTNLMLACIAEVICLRNQRAAK